MLRHYLKVFFHNLFRQKVITLINIAGLAIGMAVFILISLYVKEEYSYEQRWEKADRIVRTVHTLRFNADSVFEQGSGSPMALEKFREFFPEEVEIGTRVFSTGQRLVIDQDVIEGSVNYVDPEILKVFNFEEVSGSLDEALAAPGRIALEEERARTLFSGEALGRSITLRLEDGSERDFEVSAIYRLPEGKGQLEFPNMTLLLEELQPDFMGTESNWLSGEYVTTYLLLREPDDAESINARADEFVEQYVRLPWMPREDGAPITNSFSMRVQPVRDIYFSPLMNEDGGSMSEEGGSQLMANSFALVAALVLLIAITNFVILSIARSAERTREVGVRKANGADRLQLQFQFLLEALFQVVLAFLMALALFEVTVPLFESLMRTELLTQVFSPRYFIWALSLVTIVTLLGGMYPAFVLASSNPERGLKLGGIASVDNVILRKVLVSFQFTIAVGLIIATFVVYQQLVYMKQHDAGFDAESVVSLVLNSAVSKENSTALANAITKIEGVSLVTPASRAASSKIGNLAISGLLRDRRSDVSVQLYSYQVGYNFFSLYSMDILAGRVFSPELDLQADRITYDEEEKAPYLKIVANESAVRDLGFASPQEAVGELLYTPYRVIDGERRFAQYEIIGVVADSQFDSLRNAPQSELFYLSGSSNALLSFRVEETSINRIREKVENVWRNVVGIGNPMIVFGRDITAVVFNQEENEGRLLIAFSLLAILVSCMGLYGLVAFDTSRRTKEIGVRKVLGGNHGNIQFLFLRQYFWPMLAANLIAWPIAIWAMQKWLERFPYQIEAWLFIPICLMAGLMVIVIAGSTLGLTVLRAFRSKPAQSLRYE